MRYMLLIHGRESRWDSSSEAERAEQFGGYFLVDCDQETALASAAEIPAAEGGTIEVRPLVEGA
jgi:hypothetical protein